MYIVRCHSVINYILPKEITLALQIPSKFRQIKYKISATMSWHTQYLVKDEKDSFKDYGVIRAGGVGLKDSAIKHWNRSFWQIQEKGLQPPHDCFSSCQWLVLTLLSLSKVWNKESHCNMEVTRMKHNCTGITQMKWKTLLSISRKKRKERRKI